MQCRKRDLFCGFFGCLGAAFRCRDLPVFDGIGDFRSGSFGCNGAGRCSIDTRLRRGRRNGIAHSPDPSPERSGSGKRGNAAPRFSAVSGFSAATAKGSKAGGAGGASAGSGFGSGIAGIP